MRLHMEAAPKITPEEEQPKLEVHNLRTAGECPLILSPGLFEEYREPEAVLSIGRFSID